MDDLVKQNVEMAVASTKAVSSLYRPSSFGSDIEPKNDANPSTVDYKAKLFLQNMKTVLLKRANDMKKQGKIPQKDRLGKHLNPLVDSYARSLLAKEFAPFLRSVSGGGGGNVIGVSYANFTRVRFFIAFLIDKYLLCYLNMTF